MPLPRTEVASASWRGGLVIAGGMTRDGRPSRRADLYFREENRWRRLPDLPIPVHHAAMTGDGAALTLLGGYTANNAESDRVFQLRDPSGEWTELPRLPAPRAAHAAAAFAGRLVVAGGVTAGAPTATSAVFENGAWRAGPPLARPREHLAATVARGRMYVIAGRAGTENFADVESWDGVAAGWNAEPALNDARGGNAAATVADRPCVAGGEELRPGGSTIASVECLESARWERVAELRHPRHGLAVVGLGDRLHVVGGGRRPGLTVSGDHEVFVFG